MLLASAARGRRPGDRWPASPGSPRRSRPAAPATANVATPGELPRLRVRPVPGPDPEGDGHLAEALAVPRGRHLHLRRLPRLPQPAEPDADLGHAPSSRNGWRLLPITLGPQASCNPRFPRYGDDHRISSDPGAAGKYAEGAPAGRRRGRPGRHRRARRWASPPGSTLWYDLEGFDQTNTPLPRVRAGASSAAGPSEIHALHYVSGVYSSAGSGIRALDQARVNDPDGVPPPRPDLDRPLGRRGQHVHVVHPQRRLAARRPDEAVPGRPQRDLGRRHDQHRPQLPQPRQARRRAPSATAAASTVDFADYPRVEAPASDPALVKALQCLLTEQKAYAGKITGTLQRRDARGGAAPGRAGARPAACAPFWTVGPG